MIGESFGNYRIVRVLGQGGMGVVYVAEHVLLGRKAVIKQLLPELSRNADVVQRFFNEARAATMIRHPGIVDVFDFGHHSSGAAFLVMELLDGESLADRIARERLPVDLVAYIARQIASPLAAAHAAGIVHRDLKPDNVFVSPDPDAPYGIRIKLLDFGIAKLAGELTAGGVKTRTGSVMGTPTYMAPEQCHGAADLDHRADIYALGCIVFEMSCGRPPFVGQGLGEILAAHMFNEPPRPSQLAPMPAMMEQLVLHMLAKAPAARPASMEPVIAALDSIRRTLPGAQMSGALEVPATLPPTISATPTPAPYAMPTTPAMVAPITTLGGAAGMVQGSVPPTMQLARKRRWAIPLAVVAALGAAGAITAVMMARRSSPADAIGSAGSGSGSGSGSATSPAIACDAGNASSCVDAGIASLHAKQPWRARDQLDRGCTQGNAAACGRLGQLLLTGGESVPVDAMRAVSSATRGCDGSDGVACATLAEAASRGSGMSPDAALATRSAAAACKSGNGIGCAIASDIALLAGHAEQADTFARAAASRLVEACDARDDAACVRLAELRSHGRGGPRDLTAAAKALQAACDRDSGEACNALARAYELGQGVTPDAVRAEQVRRRGRASLVAACDVGRAAPCAVVGRQLALDHTSDRDASRAATLLARGCDAGEGDACVTLARMTEIGDGVVKSSDRASELYRRARTLLDRRCMVADAAGCIQAGGLYSGTSGGTKDTSRAAVVYQRACSTGRADGCIGWAAADKAKASIAFRAALEVSDAACTAGDASACALAGGVRCVGPKELADGKTCVARYRTSCDAGLAEGCFDLAWAIAKGVDGPADRDAARRYYESACDKEYGPACNNLANLRVEAHDFTGAATKFQAGCDAGDASSCANLASLYDSNKATPPTPSTSRTLLARACILGAADACE